MDKFCVITNSDKDADYQMAEYIKSYLRSVKKECIIIKDTYGGTVGDNKYTDFSELPDDIQGAIVLGGDGTIIQASSNLAEMGIPILGVNLGTLGFLTEVEKHNIIPSLDMLIQDKYSIECRMMMRGSVCSDGKQVHSSLALNDFVVGKNGFCHVIRVKVYVNGEYIDTYVGDGIIISTSTGSTAYNLSAGGAILSPEIEALIITPVCPHSLNKRSLIISSTDKIVLKIGRNRGTKYDDVVAVRDGNKVMEMQSGDAMIIEKADVVTKLIKLSDTTFFERLRNKFGKEY